MAEGEIDTLTINVELDSKNTNRDVGKITGSLTKLQNAVKGIDLSVITSLTNSLNKLAKVDLSGVSDSMKVIGDAIKGISGAGQQATDDIAGANSGKKVKDVSKEWDKTYRDILDNNEKLEGLLERNTTRSADLGQVLSNNIGLSDHDFYKKTRESLDVLNSNLKQYQEDYIKYQAQINNLGDNPNKTAESLKELQGLQKNIAHDTRQINTEYSAVNLNMSNLGNLIKQVQNIANDSALSVEQQAEAYKELGVNASNISKDTVKGIKEISTEASKGRTILGGFFKWLSDRTLSVASYRMIRRMIQLIFQTIQEGIQNVAQVDDNINASMSNLLNSWNALKSSLGATVGYLIELIEPLLTPIIDAVTEVINVISMLMSAMAGNTTYQKAIKTQEDYAEALAKTKSALTGIDELNTLSNETTPDEMYEEVEIASGLASLGGAVGTIVDALGDVLKLLEPIMELIGTILDALDPVFEVVGALVDFVVGGISSGIEQITVVIQGVITMISDSLGIVKDMLSSVINFFKAIVNGDWTKVWDSFKQVVCDFANFFIHIWNAILDFFESVVNGLCNAINKIGSWFGADWNLGIDFSGLKGADLTIDSFANGGFVDEGQLFIANESGAELVGSMNGRTAVANNEEITQGIYEAVRDALSDSDLGSSVKVYLDGKEIASKIKTDNGASMYKGGV